MQKTAEEWPSLSRVRSCNNRDKNKVSCETLSKVDWYSRRPHEAQYYYYSDGDEIDYWKGEPATEAEEEEEEEEEDEEEEEGGGRGGNEGQPEIHGDGKGFSVPGHHFLAFLPAKMVYGRPAMPVRKDRKTENTLRTYPSPIPHSCGVLPHSGPIKLHMNMHVSSHSTHLNKATSKASSIIPPNVASKTKPPGFKGDEPSSPEVTCLGRVRIKHKYCKEIGKLAAAVRVADDDKKQQPAGGHEWKMMKLRREKKKNVGAAEAESATAERGKMGLCKAMEVEDPENHAEKGGKPAGKGKWRSGEGIAKLTERAKQGWGSRGEAPMASDATSDSAVKGRKERWSLRGATMHEEKVEFRQGKQKWRSSEAEGSSLQVDFAIDLSRFSSSEIQRGQGAILAKSLATLIGDGSQRFEQEDGTEFVPQVAPQNSLLLMKNSRNRENSATSSSSRGLVMGPSMHTHAASEEHVMDLTLDTRASLSSSMRENPNQISSSLLEVKMEKPATTASMAEKHRQISSLLKLKMEKPSSAASMVEKLQQITLLQVKNNAMAHRQASLPKPPPEASLWLRRAVAKPSALDIRKPIKPEIKQPTTR